MLSSRRMADSELSLDDVRAHLRRVMTSAGFLGSESIKRLLAFTVEKTLAGESGQIKEYTLGLEVFGRRESFDPRTDAIVRVQAWKLRERLLTYYESEGAQESIRIEYRKGSYVPHIITAHPAQATLPRSIAVIPFIDLGPGHDNAYLCDGVTEELIFQLSCIEQLRVVSRSSCFAFRGGTSDIRSLGQRLHADLIVQGTVRQSGDSVRITVQLIKAEDGYHLCSERWDCPMTDLFAVQDEIASAIVKSLRPHLAGTPAASHPTHDHEAYHLYLKGRHFWNQRTEHGFRRAIEYYEAAIARDPCFARAWSAIAETYQLIAAHHLDSPDICMPKARQAAGVALSFDPRLAAAHSAMAAVLMTFDHNPEAAKREWDLALQIDPHYAQAWHWLAVFGNILGITDDALTALRQAERLEPLSAAIACDFGFLFYWARRYAEAIDACHRALDLHPSFVRTYVPLARAHAAQGRYKEAVEICLEARPLFRGRAFLGQLLATLGYCYGRSGRSAEAGTVLDELRQMGYEHYVSAYDVATIYAGMGNHEQTMDSLRRATEDGAFWLIALPIEPLFDPMRGIKRFEDLCNRIWSKKRN
jgi:TolB-like protein/tetratricopeptide (TPR) repeat protein